MYQQTFLFSKTKKLHFKSRVQNFESEGAKFGAVAKSLEQDLLLPLSILIGFAIGADLVVFPQMSYLIRGTEAQSPFSGGKVKGTIGRREYWCHVLPHTPGQVKLLRQLICMKEVAPWLIIKSIVENVCKS